VLASLAVLDLALAFGTIHIAATRPALARARLLTLQRRERVRWAVAPVGSDPMASRKPDLETSPCTVAPGSRTRDPVNPVETPVGPNDLHGVIAQWESVCGSVAGGPAIRSRRDSTIIQRITRQRSVEFHKEAYRNDAAPCVMKR